MKQSLLLACAALFASCALGAGTDEWKKRSVYQLLTDRYAKGNGGTGGCDLSQYCGGDFQGITNQLQYIKDLGFDAIWISPVIDNTEGSYHGYHGRKWYEINYHFGGNDPLTNLVKAAHSMDMWVMVDVVANHVGPVGHDFSQINPFNSEDHYHSECGINDWNN
jgi:alpha-amylase